MSLPTNRQHGDIVDPVDINAIAAEVNELSQSGTSVPGVPIFGSQAEALAWEADNPGKVALWFDGPGNLVEVTATAPTFTDISGTASDTYTIPTKAGVVYKVAGVVKAAGTYPGSGTVTITAEAAEGYTLTGTASWSHTFSSVTENTPVTPTGPTWTDDEENGGGTWTTPTQTGVTYSPASGTATPGQVVTVTATAQSGYYLTGYPSGGWSHTFPSAPVGGDPAGVDTFSAETVGQPPSGWSVPWVQTGTVFEVVTDAEAIGGKALKIGNTGSNTRLAYVWDEQTSANADVEYMIKYKYPEGTPGAHFRPLLRASGAATTEHGIVLAGSTSAWSLIGLNAGTSVTGLGNLAASGGASGIWRIARVRIDGLEIKMRTWYVTDTEPSTWSAPVTLPAWAATAGKVGFYCFSTSTAGALIDWVSVAYGGATATNPEV